MSKKGVNEECNLFPINKIKMTKILLTKILVTFLREHLLSLAKTNSTYYFLLDLWWGEKITQEK